MAPDLSSGGHRKRLREKFLKTGGTSFADYEILELLLTYAIGRRDVKPLAKSLLARFKNLSGVIDADFSELASVSGIGESTAILLKVARNLCVRYLDQDIRSQTFLTSVDEFSDYAKMRLGEYTDEVMLVFYMNTRNMLIDAEIISEGMPDFVPVFPSLIAKKALKAGAHSIVLCHNHPGGLAHPSVEDTEITRDIKKTLKAVDIILLDHIIVSKFGSFSFRRADDEKPLPLRILDSLE